MNSQDQATFGLLMFFIGWALIVWLVNRERP